MKTATPEMTPGPAVIDGRRNYAAWSRRAPFTCGSCGAVSSFPCHHQRPPAAGDHVRVQVADATFGATIRVIVTGEHGSVADVVPDGAPGTVLTVSGGPRGSDGRATWQETAA